ncbi:adiponectin receptor protein 1-like [Rhopilema esculentum]|uniref:adiponectin receptor protein 1-like n=1 Tax=Rhopilema esculentum TaxID=499914 RepID=UPI0031E36668|eukprot:gene11478-21693_t
MHKDESLTDIPVVVIKEVSEPPEEAMGKLEDNKDEEAYQDFVTTFLDKLCENCKKMREQIIIKAKCAGVLPDENLDVENFVSESLVALIPEAQRKVIDNIRRRTMSDIDWQELSMFNPASQLLCFEENCSCMPDNSWTEYTKHKIAKALKEGHEELVVAFRAMENDMQIAAEQAGKCIKCVLNTGWNVVSHWELPDWLRDNEFLSHGHRPQLPSFKQCFSSMFRLHTETGNIWTHLIGLVLFLLAMFAIFARPLISLSFKFPSGWAEYLVFGAFFLGAILCLMFSWLFHTVYCHSVKVHSVFSKLDYSGIAFLIMGSFVPCLYYGFYCRQLTQIGYLISVFVLGTLCIIVSLWDKFGTPKFRPLRAGLFLCLGCSGVVPSIHMVISLGFTRGVEQGALGWLVLMGALYIIGALMYAFRVPERFFPGKCNFWFQSHQIFHILVVAAAFIHLHGICQMAYYRLKIGRVCPK